jgi:uncharacterized membrane protein YhdT
METFLTIFCAILAILSLMIINLAMYKTIIESLENVPKWLNRVLLIPPFSFVAMLIILVVFVVSDISNKLKKYW